MHVVTGLLVIWAEGKLTEPWFLNIFCSWYACIVKDQLASKKTPQRGFSIRSDHHILLLLFRSLYHLKQYIPPRALFWPPMRPSVFGSPKNLSIKLHILTKIVLYMLSVEISLKNLRRWTVFLCLLGVGFHDNCQGPVVTLLSDRQGTKAQEIYALRMHSGNS
jgi:hypothetical protein